MGKADICSEQLVRACPSCSTNVPVRILCRSGLTVCCSCSLTH